MGLRNVEYRESGKPSSQGYIELNLKGGRGTEDKDEKDTGQRSGGGGGGKPQDALIQKGDLLYRKPII